MYKLRDQNTSIYDTQNLDIYRNISIYRNKNNCEFRFLYFMQNVIFKNQGLKAQEIRGVQIKFLDT